MENPDENQPKKEENKPEIKQETVDSKENNDKIEKDPINKINENNKENIKEEEKKSEEKKENIDNNKDNKSKDKKNNNIQLEKIFDENLAKMISTWESDNNNFGYYYHKELYTFIIYILRNPCIIAFKDTIAFSFKFLCNYFSYFKDKLTDIPIPCMFLINWLFSHKVNLFSLYPKVNYIDEFDEQRELIGDNFFYIIVKEIEPNIKIENPQLGYYYNSMLKYLLEYLLYIGFFDDFINIFLERDDLQPYSYISFTDYVFHIFNFCEDAFLEKNNYMYNYTMIRNFTKKMDYFILNFDNYMKEGKESKEKYINFVKHIEQNYYSIIFGTLGRILDISQKRGELKEIDDFIFSIFSLYELLLRQQKLEFRILSMDCLNSFVYYYNKYDDKLQRDYYSPKNVYEYTRQKYILFLDKLNIFELIFGENIHEALIERSNEILVFLYNNNLFKKEQISLLWKISKAKSQSINNSIITLLSRILPEFSKEDCDIILEEISNIPLKDVNEVNLKLFENFFTSENRYEKLLNILFKYSNEFSFYEGLSTNIINKSRNILVKLLFNKEYKKDLIHFMKNCLFCLSNNYLMNTHRNILIDIINEFNKNEKEENVLEIFKLINGAITSFKDLIIYLDEKYSFFSVLMGNLFFIKKFMIFLLEEGIWIKQIFDQDVTNFNYENILSLERIMKIYIGKNINNNIDKNNNSIQQNSININKENELNYNNSTLPNNSESIENYHKQIIKEYIEYLKKNILIKEKTFTEKEMINNIFTKFEFSYAKNTYQNILSKTIDTVFSFHEFSDTCINQNLINFLYELLVNNCLYEQEKESFFNFIKNIFIYQFNNYNLNLLKEEAIDDLCLKKIPSNEIISLPYSAYESMYLYLIYKNEKNGNIEYSHENHKFIKIKKIKLLIGLKTLLNFYINNNDITIALNSLDTLTNIIEVATTDMINRKYILEQLFSLLEKYQIKKEETPLRRILRLISTINKTKVTMNLYDPDDPNNILELNINNDFYNNNNQDNIQKFHAFKGLTIQEFKEELIDNLLCKYPQDLYNYNYCNQSPHSFCPSLEHLKSEIKLHDLIVLCYNDKILKNKFTLAEYDINSGDIILLLNKNAIGLNEDEFNLTDTQLKEGYEQIKVVFNDKFSDEIMKEALKKNKGDIQNSIIYLTDEKNVENLMEEVDKNKKEEPKKKEEQFCLEAKQFDLLLNILNEENSKLSDTIWDLFSEIKFQDEFINDSIGNAFDKIFEEKNMNKIILILKIINSLIFDDNTFCKSNKFSKEIKNKWISKFINNEEFICKILKYVSELKNKECTEKNYFDIMNIFLNYFKIIFSEIVKLIKKNSENIINESEKENKKFDIKEKDINTFIEILSKNNFINYIYRLFTNITELNKLRKKIIIKNIFEITLNYLRINREDIERLLNEEKDSKKILNILILEKEEDIRKEAFDFLKELINEFKIKDKEDDKIDVQSIILQYYYPYLISEEVYFEQFYELFNYLFNLKQVKLKIINIQEIISKILEYIYVFYINNNNKISDDNIGKIKNKIKYNLYILLSFSNIYDELIQKEIDLKLNEKKDIISILYDFLFNIKKIDDNNINYIFSEDKLRENTFQILSKIISLDKKYFDIISSKIFNHHNEILLKKTELPLSNSLRDFSINKYLGLKNFGATCYLNSLFQQLFMIPTFYNDIFKFNIYEKINEINLEENTIYQMQLTFTNLQKSIMPFYPPLSFIKSFKSAFNGEPIKLTVQQDTDEFLSILCDKLEKEAKLFENENFLENSFKGKVTNEIVSLEKDYPYYSQTEENFYSITLDIKNHKNLEEALDAYVKGEILEGENKYFVEKYKKKISIKKRNSLKKIGNQIIIHLKRFEFDFYTFQNNKLNDYLKFPMKLNLKKWTRAYLRINEVSEENNIEEEEKENLDDNKMEYELTGILIHNGSSLQSGHYYSLIKTEDDKWYKFNDNEISEYNIEQNLEKDCFGNIESKVNQYGKGAYLLFYTKKECINKYKNYNNKKIINENILKEVENENISFLKIKTFSNNLYHKFFISFINDAIKYLSLSKKENTNFLDSLMNEKLRKDVLIYEKIKSELIEKGIYINIYDSKTWPENIVDIYQKVKLESSSNNDNFKKEINFDNLINLFCYYFFGIVLQYNDKEDTIKECIKTVNDIIKKDSILTINVMKIIEQNNTMLKDLLFKYGRGDKFTNIKKDINDFFSSLFLSSYKYEVHNNNNQLISDKYIYLDMNENGELKIKESYKSLYLRLFQIIFCDNLEKSRKEYSKNMLFLELFFSIIKDNLQSNIVTSQYLLTLVSLITNNNLPEFKSDVNPNIKMDNSNQYYLKIFCQIVLTCSTPAMIYLKKESPYLLLKLDDVTKYQTLPLNFGKIYIQDFVIYYLLNNTDDNIEQMLCHLCWEDEGVSIQIISIVNNFLKINYFTYPLFENVFFNIMNIFKINDSFTHKRLDTLFELEDEVNDKTLIQFFIENKNTNYIIVLESLYIIAKIIEKYDIVFEYFKKNNNKIEWVKEYYTEFFDNKYNISFLNKIHPDILSTIETQFINKLEI